MIVATLLGWLLSGAFATAWAQNHVALVIGNNHYPNLDPDRQLQKAANDATAVGDALQRDGFKVLTGIDLTRAQMVDKLYEMSALLHPGDTALFYFAGHGVALGNGNYLIPTDVPDIDEGQELRLANQSVAEADVIATLQDKGARVSIMIFDACRDNPFRRPGLRSIGMERGLGRMPEANGVFSLYSAGYGQSALDRLSEFDANPNSVFTRVLAPLLTRPGLNLDDLAFEVREQVAKLAASTPEHHQQIPAAYNQIIGGRVYLASAEPNAASEPAPPADVAPAAKAAPEPPPQAPQKTAEVEPPPSPADNAGKTARSLALSLQGELNRLGCDAGPATGEWNLQSRMALLRFSESRKLALNVDEPDPAALARMRAETRAVCKVEVQTAPIPPKHAPATPARRAPRLVAQEVEHRAPERTVRHHPATGGGGSCFVFNGQSVCE